MRPGRKYNWLFTSDDRHAKTSGTMKKYICIFLYIYIRFVYIYILDEWLAGEKGGNPIFKYDRRVNPLKLNRNVYTAFKTLQKMQKRSPFFQFSHIDHLLQCGAQRLEPAGQAEGEVDTTARPGT